MSDNVRLDLLEMIYQDMLEFPAIAMLGKRRAGKTTQGKRMLEDLCENCDRVIVMCGNDDAKEEWMDMVPRLNVVDKNLIQLQKIFLYQMKKCAKYRRKKVKVPRKYRLILILDDCGGDKEFMHSDTITKLQTEGRHLGITCVFMLQDLGQMLKTDRRNFDYIGMMYTADDEVISEVKKFYINRRTCDLARFTNLVNALTKNKNVMWIDGTKTPNCVEDYIFHKSYNNLKNYKFHQIGSKRTREYAEEHYIDTEKVNKRVKEMETNKNTAISMNFDTDEDDNAEDYYGYDENIPEKVDEEDDVIEYLAKNRMVFNGKGGCVINKLFNTKHIKID